jgi:peptidoglycan-associated lipoprotein
MNFVSFPPAGGIMRKLVYAAVVAVFLAGCTTQQTQPEAPIDDKSGAGASAGAGGATTSGTGSSGVTGAGTGGAGMGGAGGAGNPLRDPASILSKRSVFFDFDSFVVKDEFRPLVEAHARYLQQNRSARVTVQGNTDERGSREYNIALGQRRADAVKRMMTLTGAQDAQIETVSFGKEKPRDAGHDEAAWAQNRRGDIVYAGE